MDNIDMNRTSETMSFLYNKFKSSILLLNFQRVPSLTPFISNISHTLIIIILYAIKIHWKIWLSTLAGHFPFELERKKLFCKNLPTHCEFLVLFAAKSWRRKENFPLVRADNSVMVPLLGMAAPLVSDSSSDDDGGGVTLKWNVLSMRMIWLKLGRILGSSTQHDCMINARSGEMSSGRLGRSCCILRKYHHTD